MCIVGNLCHGARRHHEPERGDAGAAEIPRYYYPKTWGTDLFQHIGHHLQSDEPSGPMGG